MYNNKLARSDFQELQWKLNYHEKVSIIYEFIKLIIRVAITLYKLLYILNDV